MTLQQLKYVIAIADSGSVNSAAKNLYLSQPSLSSAVRRRLALSCSAGPIGA